MQFRYMESDLPEAKKKISELIEQDEAFEVHWVELELTLTPEARALEIIVQED